MTIFTLPWVVGLSSLVKQLTVVFCVMQGSSSELSSRQPLSIYIYVNKTKMMHMHLNLIAYVKFPRGYALDSPASMKNQPGFDHSFKHFACLATLKSYYTTKQSVDDYVYITSKSIAWR